jgi:hypothetical protein
LFQEEIVVTHVHLASSATFAHDHPDGHLPHEHQSPAGTPQVRLVPPPKHQRRVA